MEPQSLSLHHVHKSFGHLNVLDALDLTIPPGESFVLLGRSGSGKSVLLKCLLGLIPIDRGTLFMDGVSVVGETARQQKTRMGKIGMVFQGSALFDSLPVWENVAFGLLMNSTTPRKEARALAFEKLDIVGLEAAEVADLLPSSLSGGMQRRVALARAIALSPAFLFLDEPTAGLDPLFSRLIADVINTCRKTLGATTLTITHDLQLARRIADRVGMLSDGAIVWSGPVETLPYSPNPLVQAFIGAGE